jgi:hypothetical protein
MTPPECRTPEGIALRNWYANELRDMADEVAQLRLLQHQDRRLLLELTELVRHISGVDLLGAADGVTLQ